MTSLPSTISFDKVAIGEALPSLQIPITRTLIVSTAIATRDYQIVHHDPTVAVERGSQDIIMNILTSNAFVGRFVTDWAGPNAFISAVKVRLGAPNYPGDTMTLTGTVTTKDESSKKVTIAVQGANSLGDHLHATVEVILP